MSVVFNKKARFNYEILSKLTAGIELLGCEVKSIRAGNINLNESFVFIKNDEVYLKNCYIKPYSAENNFSISPTRDRKLLLNKSEIIRLKQKVSEKGLTLVALKVFFERNLVKVEIALAKGKKLYDKKQTLKERDIQRESGIK